MEQVGHLQRLSILLAKEAVGARTAIAQRAIGKNFITTAVNFNNIRIGIPELERLLSVAESTQQRLITIAKAIDDSIVTLFDFVKEVARSNSRRRSINQHLNALLAMMNKIHELCVAIKYTYKADTSSHSMYSAALFEKMTKTVEHYVHGQKDAKAIRNYAIMDEIVILADLTLGLMHRYLGR